MRRGRADPKSGALAPPHVWGSDVVEDPVPRLPSCEAHRLAPFVYTALHRPSDLLLLRRVMHSGKPEPLPFPEASTKKLWPPRGVAGRLACECGIRRATGTTYRRLYSEGVRQVFQVRFNFFSISFHVRCTGRRRCRQSPPPYRCGSTWPTNACGAVTRYWPC